MEGNACLALPISIVNRAITSEERDQYVISLLQNSLPSSDKDSFTGDLKKTFMFNKVKTKHRRRKSTKKTFLTNRKRIALGLNELKNGINLEYKDALALNEMWLEYMRQMLDVHDFTDLPETPVKSKFEIMGQHMIKADFHGAKITVVRSKCPSLVNISGIILQDTKCTFRVLGEDNILRTIPKDTSVFKIQLGSVNLQLFGKKLCYRPAERSVKKVKTTYISDL
ncbi:ribonuclease P protein subunit p29 [Athalia rosae]|uniref:ribonuclease P protein subunit p29 n=1 Tax=Athalia rosae TaxID=37344 RepID=UPI00062591D9|nr:ribonuclease P protein subunit p29 [Athalia rosae]